MNISLYSHVTTRMDFGQGGAKMRYNGLVGGGGEVLLSSWKQSIWIPRAPKIHSTEQNTISMQC